ncbi:MULTISPECIES: hypothetical protein [Ensifer]|jgi:methyl-accepting chemotaxis protein|uniref:hypothetical protein n=1 Tax=Ensifer TaxID=106591 RepID=UPI00071307A4|nr:hypothetical protein [Ensifer sp. Root954]KQX43176.1 hypothetical protein ASD49_10965 [Ensifer sp. Root1298]KQX72725.1 hypothetical protein ASD41_11465 [Ensifer sp. Root1312]KRC15691.1 hypothetical protein ASE29_11020 [Ensifer sp. Root74]KRD58966.1 hypothetical protein ASE71_09095 [Ensifer sp. Root954]
MSQIANSARDQSIGLVEVNTAITQMDRLTQQNAAMVEETSAASVHLARESGDLRMRLSHFTLLSQPDTQPAILPRHSLKVA